MYLSSLSPQFTQTKTRLLCVCLVLIGFFAEVRPSFAEDDEPLENRFLFVIETSASMSRSADAVQGAMASILGSEMQGQLHKGDTVGLWTYNDKLSTDFPMQVWSGAQKKNILDAVSAHLHSVRYAKKGRLDRVWPSISSVMKSSRTLTVVFIYDGTEEIKGTRFDSEINDLQKEYQGELRSANLPFVTVLAARNGDFFEYTVNTPSSTIRIPQTAEPVKKAESTPPTPTNAPPVKPREIRHVVIAPTLVTNSAPVAPTPIAPATNRPSKPDPAPTQTPQPTTVPLSNPPPQTVSTPASDPTNAPSAAVPTHEDIALPPGVTEARVSASGTDEAAPSNSEQKSPTVVVTPPAVVEPKGSMTFPLMIGCGLLAFALGIIVYLLRYLHGKEQSSLISQSMKREVGR